MGDWLNFPVTGIPLLHGGDTVVLTPGLSTGGWVDMLMMGVHMVGAYGLLTMLATLTLLSWAVLWSRDTALTQGLRSVRRRILLPLWLAISLLGVTGIFNHYHNVPFPLPHPWNLQDIVIPYGKAYVMLLLGKHIFVAQLVLALAMVSWRLVALQPARRVAMVLSSVVVAVPVGVGASPVGTGPAPTTLRDSSPQPSSAGERPVDPVPAELAKERAAERGTAWIATLGLLSGVLILLTTTAVNHVHLLTHGHGL